MLADYPDGAEDPDEYLALDDELRGQVSGKIREEYQNGRHYYALEGKRLEVLPKHQQDKPDLEFVTWHQQNVFVS